MTLEALTGREVAGETPRSQVPYGNMEVAMLGLILGGAALGAGFYYTRKFVRERLRFVDFVKRPAAPVVAGVAAAALAAPVVALLPIVGAGTAIATGIGVAAGVASGRREPPVT